MVQIPQDFPQWLTDMVLGHFPDGHPKPMRVCADSWSDSANALAALADRLETAAAQLAGAVEGETGDAIQRQYRQLIAETRAQVEFNNDRARQLYENATAMEFEQYVVIGIAGVLLAQVMWDLLMPAPGSVLKAISDRAAAKAGMELAKRDLILNMLARAARFAAEHPTVMLAARGVFIGAAAGGGVTWGAQRLQVAQGHRDAVDWERVKVAAAAGAGAGLVGVGVGTVVAPAVTRVVGRVLGALATGGVAGIFGGLAGGLIAWRLTGGELRGKDLATMIWTGLGSGLASSIGASVRAARVAAAASAPVADRALPVADRALPVADRALPVADRAIPEVGSPAESNLSRGSVPEPVPGDGQAPYVPPEISAEISQIGSELAGKLPEGPERNAVADFVKDKPAAPGRLHADESVHDIDAELRGIVDEQYKKMRNELDNSGETASPPSPGEPRKPPKGVQDMDAELRRIIDEELDKMLKERGDDGGTPPPPNAPGQQPGPPPSHTPQPSPAATAPSRGPGGEGGGPGLTQQIIGHSTPSSTATVEPPPGGWGRPAPSTDHADLGVAQGRTGTDVIADATVAQPDTFATNTEVLMIDGDGSSSYHLIDFDPDAELRSLLEPRQTGTEATQNPTVLRPAGDTLEQGSPASKEQSLELDVDTEFDRIKAGFAEDSDQSGPNTTATSTNTPAQAPDSTPPVSPRPMADANRPLPQVAPRSGPDATPRATHTGGETNSPPARASAPERNLDATPSPTSRTTSDANVSAPQTNPPRSASDITTGATDAGPESNAPAHTLNSHESGVDANPTATSRPAPETDNPAPQSSAPRPRPGADLSPSHIAPSATGFTPHASEAKSVPTSTSSESPHIAQDLDNTAGHTASPKPAPIVDPSPEALSNAVHAARATTEPVGETSARPATDSDELPTEPPEFIPREDLPAIIRDVRPGYVPDPRNPGVPEYPTELPPDYQRPRPAYVPIPGIPNPPDDEPPRDAIPVIPHLPATIPTDLPADRPRFTPADPDSPGERDDNNTATGPKPQPAATPWITPLPRHPAAAPTHLPATPSKGPAELAPTPHYASPRNPETPGAPQDPTLRPGPHPDSLGYIPDLSGLPDNGRLPPWQLAPAPEEPVQPNRPVLQAQASSDDSSDKPGRRKRKQPTPPSPAQNAAADHTPAPTNPPRQEGAVSHSPDDLPDQVKAADPTPAPTNPMRQEGGVGHSLDDLPDQVKALLAATAVGRDILRILARNDIEVSYLDRLSRHSTNGAYHAELATAKIRTEGRSYLGQAVTLVHEGVHAWYALSGRTANTTPRIHALGHDAFIDAMVREEAAAFGRQFEFLRELRDLGYPAPSADALEPVHHQAFDAAVAAIRQATPDLPVRELWTRAREAATDAIAHEIGVRPWQDGGNYRQFYSNGWSRINHHVTEPPHSWARPEIAAQVRDLARQNIVAARERRTAFNRFSNLAETLGIPDADRDLRRIPTVLPNLRTEIAHARADLARTLGVDPADLGRHPLPPEQQQRRADILRREYDLLCLADVVGELGDLREAGGLIADQLAATAARDVLAQQVADQDNVRLIGDRVALIEGEPPHVLVVADRLKDFTAPLGDAVRRSPELEAALRHPDLDIHFLQVKVTAQGDSASVQHTPPDQAAVLHHALNGKQSPPPEMPVPEVPVRREWAAAESARRTEQVRRLLEQTATGSWAWEVVRRNAIHVVHESGGAARVAPLRRTVFLDIGTSDVEQAIAIVHAVSHLRDLAANSPNTPRGRMSLPRAVYVSAMEGEESRAHALEVAFKKQLRPLGYDLPIDSVEQAYDDATRDGESEVVLLRRPTATDPDALPRPPVPGDFAAGARGIRHRLETLGDHSVGNYSDFHGRTWDAVHGKQPQDGTTRRPEPKDRSPLDGAEGTPDEARGPAPAAAEPVQPNRPLPGAQASSDDNPGAPGRRKRTRKQQPPSQDAMAPSAAVPVPGAPPNAQGRQTNARDSVHPESASAPRLSDRSGPAPLIVERNPPARRSPQAAREVMERGRRSVRETLADWPVEGQLERADAIVRELVRRALALSDPNRPDQRDPEVSVRILGEPGSQRALVRVTDHNNRDLPTNPQRVEFGWRAVRMIEQTTKSWGFELPRGAGTTVWFELSEAAERDHLSQTTHEPAVDLIFPPGAVARGASQARRAVKDFLTQIGLPDDQIDDVVTLVSELVGNVDRYAPEGHARVRVWVDGHNLRVAIGDESRGLPKRQKESNFSDFDLDAAEFDMNAFDLGALEAGTHGRGIGLMEELSTVWGVTLGQGKHIWFEVPIPPTAQVAATAALPRPADGSAQTDAPHAHQPTTDTPADLAGQDPNIDSTVPGPRNTTMTHGATPEFRGRPSDDAVELLHRYFDATDASDPGAQDLRVEVERLILDVGQRAYAKRYVANERRASALSAELGMPLEQLRTQMAEELSQAFSGEIVIRTRGMTLLRILESGRFKTLFETAGRSMIGQSQLQRRAQLEQELFGYPLDMPAESRPVYGRVRTTRGPWEDEGDMASEHGDVDVLLKSTVAQRTTASVGSPWGVYAIPSSVTDPQPESFGATPSNHGELAYFGLEGIGRDYAGKRFLRNSYIEAQLHGGVTIADIDHLIFHDEPPDNLLREALGQAGIPWSMASSYWSSRSEPFDGRSNQIDSPSAPRPDVQRDMAPSRAGEVAGADVATPAALPGETHSMPAPAPQQPGPQAVLGFTEKPWLGFHHPDGDPATPSTVGAGEESSGDHLPAPPAKQAAVIPQPTTPWTSTDTTAGRDRPAAQVDREPGPTPWRKTRKPTPPATEDSPHGNPTSQRNDDYSPSTSRPAPAPAPAPAPDENRTLAPDNDDSQPGTTSAQAHSTPSARPHHGGPIPAGTNVAEVLDLPAGRRTDSDIGPAPIHMPRGLPAQWVAFHRDPHNNGIDQPPNAKPQPEHGAVPDGLKPWTLTALGPGDRPAPETFDIGAVPNDPAASADSNHGYRYPAGLFPYEAAMAAVRDLPRTTGNPDQELTLDFYPLGSDDLCDEEDVAAVATAVGDMMREQGWQDPTQIEAASELVRTAGLDAIAYMDRYTRLLQQRAAASVEQAVGGMRARLTLRLSTQADPRSLHLSFEMHQYRPPRPAGVARFTWYAPLHSRDQIGADVVAALGSASDGNIEQWGEVWARFDESPSTENGSAIVDARPREEFEAKAYVVRKLYDDHHIRGLGWEDPDIPLSAIEAADRALRDLIWEYRGRCAVRDFGFSDIREELGVTQSFGTGTDHAKDHFTSIRVNKDIFTDPAAARSWAQHQLDHLFALSPEDMTYQIFHHEWLHAVASDDNWKVEASLPAILRAAYEHYLAEGLIPPEVGYDRWLAQLPRYAFMNRDPETKTLHLGEAFAEGSRAGAVESSLPLTHPARISHWLSVTRDGTSPAQTFAKWAKMRAPDRREGQDASLLLQDFRDVTGRDDVVVPARLAAGDTTAATLEAGTGGRLRHFSDVGEVIARLRELGQSWDRNGYGHGDGVSALIVEPPRAGQDRDGRPSLLVRRVTEETEEGADRIELRNPSDGVLRANHVRSAESPDKSGVRAMFFDKNGRPILDAGDLQPETTPAQAHSTPPARPHYSGPIPAKPSGTVVAAALGLPTRRTADGDIGPAPIHMPRGVPPQWVAFHEDPGTDGTDDQPHRPPSGAEPEPEQTPVPKPPPAPHTRAVNTTSGKPVPKKPPESAWKLIRTNPLLARFLIGNGAVNLRGHIAAIAVPLVAMRLTGSVEAGGWVAFAVKSPSILFGIPSGVATNYFSPWKIMFGSQIAAISTAGAGLAAVAAGAPNIGLMLAVTIFVEEAAVVFYLTANKVAVQKLTTTTQAHSASRLIALEGSLANVLGRIVGPALAKIPPLTFLVNAILSTVNSWTLWRSRKDFPPHQRKKSSGFKGMLNTIREGWRTIRSDETLYRMTVGAAVTNAVFAAFIVRTSDVVLHMPFEAASLAFGGLAVGNLAGALLPKSWTDLGIGSWYPAALLAWTGMGITQAFSTNPFMLAVGGLGISAIGVGLNMGTVTYELKNIPEKVFGSASGVKGMIINSGTAIGSLAGAYLLSRFGVVTSGWIEVGTLASVTAGFFFRNLFRRRRNRSKREEPPATEAEEP